MPVDVPAVYVQREGEATGFPLASKTTCTGLGMMVPVAPLADKGRIKAVRSAPMMRMELAFWFIVCWLTVVFLIAGLIQALDPPRPVLPAASPYRARLP